MAVSMRTYCLATITPSVSTDTIVARSLSAG